MAKERIHIALRLSRPAFKKFLKSNLKRRFKATAHCCPIARFMGPLGFCNGLSYGTYASKAGESTVIDKRLPNWANMFVVRFGKSVGPHGFTTADKALEIYKSI